ncbi:hypothetical protein BDW75DRAFT_128157 [Aspergillus navahoensis]
MASAPENTPLLADSEPLEAGEYQILQDHSVTTAPAKPPYFRMIVVLIHLSAALSVLAFVLYLTVISIVTARPGGFYISWDLEQRIQALSITSILSFVASALNLARLRRARRVLWLWLNLLIDAVIAFFTFVLVPGALTLNFDESPDSWLPNRRAATTAGTVIVLLGIGLIAGLIAGLAHLVLFSMRCFALFRSEPSQSPWAWRIPGGEFRVDFSIKFLRQEDGSTRETRDSEAQ